MFVYILNMTNWKSSINLKRSNEHAFKIFQQRPNIKKKHTQRKKTQRNKQTKNNSKFVVCIQKPYMVRYHLNGWWNWIKPFKCFFFWPWHIHRNWILWRIHRSQFGKAHSIACDDVWQSSSCHLHTSNIIFSFHFVLIEAECPSDLVDVGFMYSVNSDYADSKCKKQNVALNICVQALYTGVIVAVN